MHTAQEQRDDWTLAAAPCCCGAPHTHMRGCRVVTALCLRQLTPLNRRSVSVFAGHYLLELEKTKVCVREREHPVSTVSFSFRVCTFIDLMK